MVDLVLDVNTAHQPLGSSDALMKFWDVWYGKLLLTSGADFFHTELLFYPQGLSLAFHNFSLPNMLLFGGLQAVLPPVNAYILTYLFTVFSNALASYVLLLRLIGDKWISLVGAAIFGFSPYFIPHIHHPETITIATIPLALYALHHGVVEQRWKSMIAAGAFAGLTAFIGMYILVCLFITMGFFTLHLASTRWRQHRFWRHVALTLVVAVSIGMIRLYPMIIDLNLLNEALDKGANAQNSTDLLVFLVNPRNPLTPVVFQTLFHRAPPTVHPDGYLGLLPLALIVIGFIRSSNRRPMIFWLAIAMIFALLRLGSALQIDGHLYPGIRMPKNYLDIIVPWLTKAFWDRAFFQIGILLPLAMLSCYGLQAILVYVPRNLRAAGTVLVIALVAVEYYQPPISPYPRYQAQYRWIEWLAAEENQDANRLINLPIGRQNSKHYLYHQTLHGYPQVEGLASRTPAAAYNYIEDNYLLSAWRASRSVVCLPGNQLEYSAAHDQLLGDGFTHIILHGDLYPGESIAASFVHVPAAYYDTFVSIYRVKDLHKSCELWALPGQSALPHLQRLDESVIVPERSVSILSIHPFESVVDVAARTYTAVLTSSHGHTLLSVEDVIVDGDPDTDQGRNNANSALDANSIIVLVYGPQTTDANTIDAYRSWLARIFNSCGRVADTEDTVIEYFLRHGFPCELATIDESLAVDYDNGMQLGNLLSERDGSILDVYLLWKRRTTEKHSFSIQFFDEAGGKIHGQDFVIRREPLAHHRLDLSALPSGEYSVKLIVYNFNTGISVSGILHGSQTPFDRELEFTAITVE